MEVLRHEAFFDLIHSQPWSSVSIRSSFGYQYAVCQKPHAGEGVVSPSDLEELQEHKLKIWSVA